MIAERVMDEWDKNIIKTALNVSNIVKDCLYHQGISVDGCIVGILIHKKKLSDGDLLNNDFVEIYIKILRVIYINRIAYWNV
jgi:hypothetical protein